MRPFAVHEGVAVPLLLDDINTDQITPATSARSLEPDYREMYFARWRLDERGDEIANCVLNRPEYRDATILVAGRNFGCGSAREGAVWALVARGVRCVVAKSFSEFYRANCVQNGVLPVVLDEGHDALAALVTEAAGKARFVVDLREQAVVAPGGRRFPFATPPADRAMLLDGLDDIGLSLKCLSGLDAFERRVFESDPWLQRLP